MLIEFAEQRNDTESWDDDDDVLKGFPSLLQVREATSNDPWGPSSSLMSEIADLTYNVVAFSEIMSMVWKRLNDHGKNWRHVYKVGVVHRNYIIKVAYNLLPQLNKSNVNINASWKRNSPLSTL